MNRSLIRIACLLIAGLFASQRIITRCSFAAPPTNGVTHAPVPMIHVTDLFRPHNDPDDHWDLATVYALAWQNEVDLLGVLIDYPPPQQKTDPDVLAVAQLNYLTGKAVPVMIGSPQWIEPSDASTHENVVALRGVRAMLKLLQDSPRPVVINILGSCRDIALAGRLEPNLFARKCAAIYLNAGSGTPDIRKAAKLEWNVSLDPRAYAAIFELPCPIYWMPCFETVGAPAPLASRLDKYGTYYRFAQGDVLPDLSTGVQNYFAYMFLHGRNEMQPRPQALRPNFRPNWLRYLVGPADTVLQTRIRAMNRNMWCTAGFLDAVGRTVTPDGKVVPSDTSAASIFTFDPIQIQCADNGVTEWRSGTSSPARFIFHVHNTSRYTDAMTSALKQLLVKLP